MCGVLGICYILMFAAIKASKKKKKKHMFGQVGAHSLSPSPLTNSMFPNSMTVTRGQSLENPQYRKPAQSIWREARRMMIIL